VSARPRSRGTRWLHTGLGLARSDTARKGVITLADQAVVSATNFLTGVIIGRTCAKEEFGLYMLGFSIILFVTNLQTSLISTPYMVYSPRLQGLDHAQYTGSTLIHQAALSALAILGLILGATAVSLGFGPQGLAPVLWVLAAVIAFIALREFIRRICFANLHMTTAFILDTTASLLQLGGLLLLAHLGLIAATTAYLIAGTACGLAALAWLLTQRHTFTLHLRQAYTDFTANWAFARWLLLASCVYSLGNGCFPWFVAYFSSLEEAGILAVSVSIASLANPFIIGMANFLRPYAAHICVAQQQDRVRLFLLRTTAIIAVFVLALAFAFTLFGDGAAHFVYGEQYKLTGGVTLLAIVATSMNALATPTSCVLQAMDRPDIGFQGRLLALFFSITLGLALVRHFGALGAAAGLLATNLAASTYEVVAFLLISRRVRLQELSELAAPHLPGRRA